MGSEMCIRDSADPLHDISDPKEAFSEELLSEPVIVLVADEQPTLHETSNTVHELFNDSDDEISTLDPLN